MYGTTNFQTASNNPHECIPTCPNLINRVRNLPLICHNRVRALIRVALAVNPCPSRPSFCLHVACSSLAPVWIGQPAPLPPVQLYVLSQICMVSFHKCYDISWPSLKLNGKIRKKA